MSEKLSHKTEEEMLDQTFGGYDEEMTVQTEGATTDGTVEPKSNNATTSKPMNSNLIIGGVVGLAAIGILGYKFMGGNQQAPVVQPPSPVAAPMPAPVAAPEPVAGAAVTSPVPPTAAVTPTDTSPAAQYLSGNPLAPKNETKVEAAPEPVAPVAVAPVAAPVVVAQAPVAAPVVAAPVEVASNPNVVANNMSQNNLANDIKSMLDKQTSELKGALDTVGSRVGRLEQSVTRQETASKNIEDRLTRLESGRAAKPVVASVKEVTPDATVVTPVKAVVKAKPVVTKKKVVRAAPTETTTTVLVDKSEVVRTRVAPRVETVYPKMELHSVYGGRIWTKNTDGSLSTYAVGDRLPDGEIIRNIDEDKFRVVTDKRTITK